MTDQKHQQFQSLSNAVRASGIRSAGEFESLALGLRGQQARMWAFLRERDQADTVDLRTHCSIGNVSECAAGINRRLEAVGELRRVVCLLRAHTNRFGEAGKLGVWRIVDAAANDEAAQ